ncbi:MAG: DPP IV N-terminal domain-containing protein [Armatimonadetes bacterium]|nr:DPP IV N-terminal domain-containing protein [Armatimonadota bacterium]MBX3108609.1 DPP IV N-terminal domain-containing protein [Fimbriimonadaceae bacterium]
MNRSLILVAAALIVSAAPAQDRWPNMPGYKEYQAGNASGQKWRVSYLRGQWTDATHYRFTDLAGAKVLDAATGKVSAAAAQSGPMPTPQQQPDRGRQFSQVKSADGTLAATYRDGNVFLTRNGEEKPVTVEGNLDRGIKYGSASWVYGEELDQRDAMGFSPDGKWLWYYRFDESQVPQYRIAMDQKKQVPSLDVECFPMPGTPNPEVDLFVYNVVTGQSKKVGVRPGAFDHGLGHYVYGINWLEDSSRLLFHRMDRRQKIREICTYEPATGTVAVANREENQAGWVDFGPVSVLGAPRARQNAVFPSTFLYLSEDSGYINIYRLDAKTGRREQLTHHQADVTGMVGQSPDSLYYEVADGKTPYHHTIWRCDPDGKNAKRLTDPNFAASASASPDGKFLTVTYQTDVDKPFLVVMDKTGKVVAKPAVESFEQPAGDNRSCRWFSFPSLDGTVTLWGKVHLPSTYQPGQKLPVLFSVYGGPLGWGATSMRFEKPDGLSEAGFAIVEVFERGGNGRGRAFRQAIYHSLGKYEIDDIAAAATALKSQPWADTGKVGVFGTSYGGYASAMCLLRYPDLFHAASASSAVTDWHLYDSTYTERYMDLPENNAAGYEFGSCLTYAKDLKGWLMLYYGTSDNNVHPSNTYQLSDALSRAGKYHEVQIGVDRGHTGLNLARMMEFFTERLIINPKR